MDYFFLDMEPLQGLSDDFELVRPSEAGSLQAAEPILSGMNRLEKLNNELSTLYKSLLFDDGILGLLDLRSDIHVLLYVGCIEYYRLFF